MATKPVTLPEWATDGGADVVEPLLAEKQTGWVLSQKPPAQWFNWWQLLVFQWMVWLDAFESEAHTWLAAQTFEEPVAVNATFDLTGDGTFTGVQTFPNGLVLGDGILENTADAAAIIRNNAGPSVEARKLLFEFTTAHGKVRHWVTAGADPVYEVTFNALWDEGGGVWQNDDILTPSRRLTMGRTVSLQVERYTAGGTSFAEGAWVMELQLHVAGAGADPGVLDDDGNGIITRSEYKKYSSSGNGIALPLEANVDVVETPDYCRNFLGEVIVTGRVASNTTIASGTKIAQLPVGHRPYRTREFPILGFKNDAVWLQVDTAGQIKLMNDGSYTVTSLFGIHLDLIRFDASF